MKEKCNSRISRAISGAIMLLVLLMSSCSEDEELINGARSLVSANANEVLIDFVDTNGRHLAKAEYDHFEVVTHSDSIFKPYLVAKEGNYYIGFKPAFPNYKKIANMDSVKISSKVYLKNEVVAIVESSFDLDSISSNNRHRTIYYTNTDNKVCKRSSVSPIRMLVGNDGTFKEEGQSKFCVVFNFSNLKLQATETIDYQVNIKGFENQLIEPHQKGMAITDNPDGMQNVTLAIEGNIHNYYNVEGVLQDSYNITYELASRELFGNNETHILKVTNSGDCYNNKVVACSFDGISCDLNSVVFKDSFGKEYIQIESW